MLEIKNLKIEEKDGWTRRIADIESDFERSDKENIIQVDVENVAMLTIDVYNRGLFLSSYMSMYYHTD